MPRHGFLLMRTKNQRDGTAHQSTYIVHIYTCVCVRVCCIHRTAPCRSQCMLVHIYPDLYSTYLYVYLCAIHSSAKRSHVWSERNRTVITKHKIKMETGIFVEFCSFFFSCPFFILSSIRFVSSFARTWFAFQFGSHSNIRTVLQEVIVCFM